MKRCLVTARMTQSAGSFKTFVRDHKPKLNAYYPFLSQDQIWSKLRQQWKQLKVPRLQSSYGKLVVKTKTRSPSKLSQRGCTSNGYLKFGARAKPCDVLSNNDGNFEQKNLCDDSNFANISNDEFDSPHPNSPFMKNKSAIDSLNAGFLSDRGGLSTSSRFPCLGRTYAGRVFELHHRTERPKITSKIVCSKKTGILRTPCKDRRNIQSRVSFSALDKTVNVYDNCQFDEENFDEDVLYIENTKTSKVSSNSRNSKVFDEIHKVKLQVINDNHGGHGCGHTSMLENSLAVKERQKLESKKRELLFSRTSLTAPEMTSTRFSKRLKKVTADICPRAAFSSSYCPWSDESAKEKLQLTTDTNAKNTFCSTKSTQLEERRRQAHFPKTCVSATPPTRLCNRFQGWAKKEDVIIEVQNEVFSSDTKIGARKCKAQDNKLNIKHENLANSKTSQLSQETVSQMIQIEAECSARCANNLRCALSCQSNILHFPRPSSAGSTKKYNDFSIEADVIRNTAKKASQKSSLDSHRKQDDMPWIDVATYEIDSTQNEHVEDVDETTDKNDNESGNQHYIHKTVDTRQRNDIVTSRTCQPSKAIQGNGVAEVSKYENNLYGINTATDFPLATCNNSDLKSITYGDTLKSYSKSETMKDRSKAGTMKTHSKSETMKDRSKAGTLKTHSKSETMKDRSKAGTLKTHSKSETMKDRSKAGTLKTPSIADTMKHCSKAETMKHHKKDETLKDHKAETMKDHHKAETLKDHHKAETMKDHRKDETLKDHSKAERMKSHHKVETLKDYYKVETLKDHYKAETMTIHRKAERMKDHHKTEKPKYHKLNTRSNKTIFESKAAFRNDVNLVEEKDLLRVDTEIICPKSGASKSHSVRMCCQNDPKKYDCKHKVLVTNGRLICDNTGSSRKYNCRKNMYNLPAISGRNSDHYVSEMLVDTEFLDRGNSFFQLLKHSQDLYKCTASCIVLPEVTADGKQIKPMEGVNKGTIMKLAGGDCGSKAWGIGGADNATDSCLEDRASNGSISETDQDTKYGHGDFMSHMADQTSTTLLQAIERLKNLSSPENLTQECVLDDGHLSEQDYGYAQVGKKSLCHMFQSIPQNANRTIFTPAKQRLLYSSAQETPSNFMDMFDDKDIFF